MKNLSEVGSWSKKRLIYRYLLSSFNPFCVLKVYECFFSLFKRESFFVTLTLKTGREGVDNSSKNGFIYRALFSLFNLLISNKQVCLSIFILVVYVSLTVHELNFLSPSILLFSSFTNHKQCISFWLFKFSTYTLLIIFSSSFSFFGL